MIACVGARPPHLESLLSCLWKVIPHLSYWQVVKAFSLTVFWQMSVAKAQTLIFLLIKILTLIWRIYYSNPKESHTLLTPKFSFQAETGQLLHRIGSYLLPYHCHHSLSNQNHHILPSKRNKFANMKEVS